MVPAVTLIELAAKVLPAPMISPPEIFAAVPMVKEWPFKLSVPPS